MSRILEFEITDAGLAASFNTTNTGLGAQFSHIALGSGLAGLSYAPTGTETALKSEFMRRPIGGGERIASNEILLQALFDGNEAGIIREVGLFTSTGALWALWSSTPIGEKTAGVPYIFAESIVIDGIDLDRVSWIAGGPSVNIIVAGPIAQLSAEIIRLQRRAVETERNRLIPVIENTWAP